MDTPANASETAAINLPIIKNLRQTIHLNYCNFREDGAAQPVNPIKRAAIPVLPFPYDQTLNVEHFLLNDSGVEHISRILAFTKNKAVRLLENSDDR